MVRRSTWIVVAVFAVLLGLAWYLQSRPEAENSNLTPTPSQSKIFDFTSSQVVGLRITGPDGRTFYSTRSGEGVWTLVEPKNPQAVDGAIVESNLTQLLELTPVSQLEAPPALEAMGLITPNDLVEIQLSDGTQHRLEVGNQTPTASGYYVRVDNTELLILNKYTLDAILGMVTKLPLQPTPTPVPTETLVEPVVTESPNPSEGTTPTP